MSTDNCYSSRVYRQRERTSQRMEYSSDDSDYEPAPIGKPLPSGTPPPVPPPRSMTLSHSSFFRSSAAKAGQERSPYHSSLFHTMRRSISADLRLIRPEGVVQISQFITQYSVLLPCQVRPFQPSLPLPSPFPKEGPLNLHFIKHTKVVVMTDTTRGEVISVPLNSAAMFSVLYDPHSNMEEAMRGYYYDTVRDVIARKPLPLLIKATRSYQGSTALSSVSQGEILRVIGTKTFLRAKQLRVQNSQGDTKNLNEKCSGFFTTAPAHLSLPVSSLIDLGIGFPATVVFTSPSRTYSSDSTFVMERIAGETCLVATDPSWQRTELNYFEVSSDLKAEVEVVEMDFQSRQELLDTTQTLFHSFLSSARPVVSEREVGKGLRDQILPNREHEGIQLVQPISIDSLPFQSPLSTNETLPEIQVPKQGEPVGESEDECDGIYAMLSSVPKTQVSSEGALPLTSKGGSRWATSTAGVSDLDQPLPDTVMPSIVRNLDSKIDGLSMAYTPQLNTILHEIEQLKFLLADIQKDIKSLQNAQPEVDEKCSENRRIVADMNCVQVVGVLKALDLPEYEEVFLRERVDGQVLLQLTDDVLSAELGVDSKLHRIRIMNLVAGRIPTQILCPHSN